MLNMKQKINEIIKHPLIYGSSIVVIGGLIANFFNFLFNLFMSRNLSIQDYGTLASIISLIGFPGLFLAALNPLVINFAGDFFAKGELGRIRAFYINLLKFLFASGLITSILFILILPVISSFFHINNTFILLLSAFIIFLGFVGVINISLLQARLAFGYQVFLSLTGAIVKLLLGILFIFLGFAANGAVLAVSVSGLILYILSFYPIRFLFDIKLTSNYKVDTKELFHYGIPSALTLLGLTSFISTDVLLVKHFFNPQMAGIYAGMSLMGRVIFYATAPIAGVMFPIIVRKHSKNEDFNNTFKFSLLLVFLPSLFLTMIYFIFPKLSILFFLKKTEYLEASSLLGFFGLFLSLYCILHITANFYLSIKKTNVYIPILIGALLQIVLISFLHETFLQIITISIALIFLLVLGLLLYYPHAKKIRI